MYTTFKMITKVLNVPLISVFLVNFFTFPRLRASPVCLTWRSVTMWPMERWCTLPQWWWRLLASMVLRDWWQTFGSLCRWCRRFPSRQSPGDPALPSHWCWRQVRLTVQSLSPHKCVKAATHIFDFFLHIHLIIQPLSLWDHTICPSDVGCHLN